MFIYLLITPEPIIDDIGDFDWLVSDLEYIAFTDVNLPINFKEDYFILSDKQFMQLLDIDIQFLIWSFFSNTK